ncbi:unnamed protein product [Brassica oleracea]|uniref:(rape) hypothetical protein n=1 Tax=Brassica napus TaxID=3708 RepID=A0A816JB03_BRANA|nr:unnamed protein product [Brassica napus]
MVVVVANIMTALKLIGRRNVISVTLLNVMCLNLSLLCAQHERADNNALKAENDKIRCENIAIRAALKHDICPNCEYPYFDEHKPRIENAHLRDGKVNGCIKVHGKTNLLPPLNATSNANLTVGSVHDWSFTGF